MSFASPSISEAQPSAYRGRFAPSPTGPLHFGSLVTAVASYLDARTNGGEWLVRIEDLDTARVQRGATDAILADLDHLGFEWDGSVWRQSQRTEIYHQALDCLRTKGFLYPCACSRREVADSAIRGGDPTGQRYPGTCAQGIIEGRSARSWRMRVDDATVCFDDRLQGRQCQNLAETVGDFVLLRADGIIAYQLAVVVDDHAQGITDIVRGADLIDSTQRQIHLQLSMGFSTPRYLHVPVATDPSGKKMSKETGAAALDRNHASAQLTAALAFLGQAPPDELSGAHVSEVWRWARESWSSSSIPGEPALPAS